jgi:hypothetical protein
MPFCPECQAEYEEGVESCTDCGVALVAELPPGETPDVAEGEPVPLRNFSNAAEAKMVADLLEENGIRAFVSGGEFTVAPSSFSDEIVLMVDERDLERATALYDAYFGQEVPMAADPGADDAPTEPSEETEGETRG